MKQLIIALGMTFMAVSANYCLAENSTGQQISKTAAASASAAKININQASVQDLAALPGIGEKKAQAILDYIAQHGPIKDQVQLTEVKGIGDKLAAKVGPYLSFN